MPSWDPDQYLKYADERSRPFYDLIARVGAAAPRRIVDLGCGPGRLTTSLAARWPGAQILGIDSSPEMIASAAGLAGGRVQFRQQDLREFTSDDPIDLIVSNATLQWVERHREVLPRLVDTLAPGGWLALQVPGNQTAPSHTLLHELAADPRFSDDLAGIDRRVMPPPQEYLADLMPLGCRVDAWETTYLHVLHGADPVYQWVSGTGARPYLQALPETRRQEFATEYKARLRLAYPAQPFGTVLPFRRIFVVAQRMPDTDLAGSPS